MALTGTTCWRLVGLFAVLTQGCQAGEFCDTNDDYNDDDEWCDQGCCGKSGKRYCCDVDYFDVVIGVIMAVLVISIVVTLVICCCVSACPLYRKGYRGNVLGTGQVTTTQVVVGGPTQTPYYVTTPGQPGVVVPQSQPAPHHQSYQQS